MYLKSYTGAYIIYYLYNCSRHEGTWKSYTDAYSIYYLYNCVRHEFTWYADHVKHQLTNSFIFREILFLNEADVRHYYNTDSI